MNNQPGLGVSGGDWRIQASWMRNSSAKRSIALVLIQLSASSFSTIVESAANTSDHPPIATFSPNDCMIDASNWSFDPINRYTVPVPMPAADAMSRTVVTS